MRITIVTIGTRGDAQPYLALAIGLQAAGHHVTLCTHENFRTFIESYGVTFAPLAGDIRAILESEEGKRLLTTRNPVTLIRKMTQLALPSMRQMTADIIDATHDADLILGSTLGYFNAMTAAQVNRVPLYLAGLQPMTPTAAFAGSSLPVINPQWPLAGIYNRLSYPFTYRLLHLVSARLLNQIRAELTGLPPLRYGEFFDDLRQQGKPVIYGFSEAALPRPPDWNANTHVTGFWFLEGQPNWNPPAELTAFLEAGTPPVYIGFGSMSDREPEAVGMMALKALRKTGQRGILLSGWEGLKTRDLPADVLLLDNVPHDWLFPRMRMVVHHGGMGTTAAALRAGVPQLVIPFSADQPFWGAQVQRLGVAQPPIPRKKLSTERLAAAIETTLSSAAIRQQVGKIGERICVEDGVSRAVSVIEGLN